MSIASFGMTMRRQKAVDVQFTRGPLGFKIRSVRGRDEHSLFHVTPSGQAANQGLKDGDVIACVGGHPVRGMGHWALVALLNESPRPLTLHMIVVDKGCLPLSPVVSGCF
jgi:hypothetical protein